MLSRNDISCNYTIGRDYDSTLNKEIRIVTVDCEKCSFISQNQMNYLNTECLKNIVKIFKREPNLTTVAFETIQGKFELTNTQIGCFSDYGRQLNEISKSARKISFKGRLDCTKRTDCETKQTFFIERILGNKYNDGLMLTNLIESYQELSQEIKMITQMLSKKGNCKKCYDRYLRYLIEIRALLEDCTIIKRYRELNPTGKSFLEIYRLILGDYNFIPEPSKESKRISGITELHTSYQVRGYKMDIFKGRAPHKYVYYVSLITDDPHLRTVFTATLQEVKSKLKLTADSGGVLKLNQVLHSEERLAEQLIRQEFPHLSVELTSYLAELVSFEIIQLNPLMALLMDDEVEEVYLDSPNSYIYLDHRRFGRCRSNIFLTPTEIESWKTKVRIEAGQRLDETSPSLKTELITAHFHVRLAVEVSPLAVDEFQMRIRKLHKKVLTITDLIGNNTLTSEAAAYLLFSWYYGASILAIGEPSSGKTTLINSIDMVGKQDWRKIYVEDVIESISQTSFGAHQSRYLVESIEEEGSKVGRSKHYKTKGQQVRECLHRTPDQIFIGELIYPEAVRAFFFLLDVGLRRSLATAHGESPERMVERFIHHDGIEPTLIKNMDIIVQLNKFTLNGQLVRRVTRITEISEGSGLGIDVNTNTMQVDAHISFKDVFQRDAESNRLQSTDESLSDLYEGSEIIKGINSLRGVYISEERFITVIGGIQSTIDKLSRKPRKVKEIIKIFQQLWVALDMNEEVGAVLGMLDLDGYKDD